MLTNYQAGTSFSCLVVQVLDDITAAPCIYEADRFKGVALRPETIYLMKQDPTNATLAGLYRCFANRLLLEDAYPLAFSKIEFAPGHDPALDKPPSLLFTLNFVLLSCVCVPAILAAVAFRGGLLTLLLGVTFVQRNGAPASRLRLFWRAMVTWSLLLTGCMLDWYSYRGWPQPLVWLAFSLFFMLALLSVALPQRGLPDRLAGT